MKTIFTIILTLLMSSYSFSGIIYVKSDGSVSNGGTSWSDAYDNPVTALTAASPGDTVVVAVGTYVPGSNRFATYYLYDDVHLFGGFEGNEVINSATIAARDFVANETILSGDINGDDETIGISDNAYNVVSFNGTELNTVIIDGFTISGGNADFNSLNSINGYGGGISIITTDGDVTLRNLIIKNNEGNSGGGLSFTSKSSASSDLNLVMNKVVVENNKAKQVNGAASGGGMHIRWSFDANSLLTVSIDSSQFLSNSANETSGISGYGGAIYLRANVDAIANISISNSLFCGNSAELYGNAIYNLSGQDDDTYNYGGTSTIDLVNTTFKANYSAAGNVIYNKACTTMTCVSSITGVNVLMWDLYMNDKEIENVNAGATNNFSYSDIQSSGGSSSWSLTGATDGGNNVDIDPIFANIGCDPKLHINSTLIDAGNFTNGHNIGYDQGFGIQPLEVSSIDDESLCQGSFWGNFDFTVKDENISSVTVTAVSSNQSFINDSYLQLSGSGENRTLTIQNASGFGNADITVYAINGQNDSVGVVFNFNIDEPVIIDSLPYFAPFGDTLYCVDVATSFGEFGLDSVWYSAIDEVEAGWNRICLVNSGTHTFYGANGLCIDSMDVTLDVIIPNVILSIDAIPQDSACGGSEVSFELNVTNESLENISITSVYSWDGDADSAYIDIVNDKLVLTVIPSNDPNWHQGYIYISDDRGDNVNIEYGIYVVSTNTIDSVYGDSFGCYYLSLSGAGNGLTEYSLDGGSTWDHGFGYPECNLYKWINYEIQQRITLGSNVCYSNVLPFVIVEDGSVEVGLNEFSTNELTIYPNPTSGLVTIVGLLNNSLITITDIVGKQVMTLTNGLNNSIVDLSILDNGTYFIQISNGVETTVSKIIIE